MNMKMTVVELLEKLGHKVTQLDHESAAAEQLAREANTDRWAETYHEGAEEAAMAAAHINQVIGEIRDWVEFFTQEDEERALDARRTTDPDEFSDEDCPF